jgi:hypothetical protein
MRRRDFLKVASVAGLGAAGLSSGRAFAFGDPTVDQAKLLPAGAQAFNMLECFLYGGLSTWESFYSVADYGRSDDPDPTLRNTQSYTFNNPGNQLLSQALKACNSLNHPVYFATDALGKKVNLGPMLEPLLARHDLLSRMRVVVTRHELEPHEAAIPLAICGRSLGSPNMASLGAHVQRYFIEHQGTGRKSPFSYVFASNDIPSDNVLTTVATGTHPGSARPLLIKVDAIDQLSTLLARGSVGPVEQRAQYDALVAAYVKKYRGRLAWKDHGPLRSPRLDALEQAARAVQNSDAVQAVLDPKLFVPTTATRCGDMNSDQPGMSLRLAAHLLTHPTEPARHCCFVDGGLLGADGGGGYDTHAENCLTQTRNLQHTLSSLLALINTPGEKDPLKLDLDRTMIVLNMEFGRSPQAQGDAGRNHWPYGYVQVYLGGPITQDQAGIHGAIGPDGRATTYVSPAEHRAASLLALGIWPFNAESFGVSDVQGATGEVAGVESVAARVLGYTL